MWLILVALAFLLYLFSTRNHDYWSKRNVKHDRPLPFFGNSLRNIFAHKTVTQLADEMYNKYPNEKIVGFYKSNSPELIIRDPEIVRHILSMDFQYFYPRGLGRNVNREPLFNNLFHVDGDTWKLLRQRLTSAFTSSKLKNMFPLVVRCAEKLQGVAAELAAQGAEYDVRELMARFTTEFIGACGFGVEMDSINNEQSHFRELGKLIFNFGLGDFFKLQLMLMFPSLKNHFGSIMRNVDKSMMSLLMKIREQRGGKPSGRHDFVDLLLELEQKGKLSGESIESPPKIVELEMDTMCQVAQLFIFFAAGFETSSSATSFMLHQMAYNPEEQSKVQQDIDKVMAKYDNKLNYDSISEMTVLHMAFKEAMRMFPSLGCLNRVCARKYTIPGTGVEITPGVKIVIPVQALQNDPAYWEQPDQFRPERFKEDPRHNYVYLPFGEGPRACIDQLLKLGYRVDLIPVSYRDYCMIEMSGRQIFLCNINNLRFNMPYDLDPVCQRAIQAVQNASVQVDRAKTFFWLRHYINNQMFKRTEYAPKEHWPFELDVAPITSCVDCARCCGILIADKSSQPDPQEERPHYHD